MVTSAHSPDIRRSASLDSSFDQLSPQEKVLAEVVESIFGKAGVFCNTPSINEIIFSYIPAEVKELNSIFSTFVNLVDRNVLKQHLASAFQGEQDVNVAMDVAKKVYEVGFRLPSRR